MLKWLPEEWKTAGGLLDDPWLNERLEWNLQIKGPSIGLRPARGIVIYSSSHLGWRSRSKNCRECGMDFLIELKSSRMAGDVACFAQPWYCITFCSVWMPALNYIYWCLHLTWLIYPSQPFLVQHLFPTQPTPFIMETELKRVTRTLKALKRSCGKKPSNTCQKMLVKALWKSLQIWKTALPTQDLQS